MQGEKYEPELPRKSRDRRHEVPWSWNGIGHEVNPYRTDRVSQGADWIDVQPRG